MTNPEYPRVLPFRWNLWIFLLSFVVGVVGSYTTTYMLYMLERSTERRHRIMWLLASCLTFGGGCIWALHFTGMMALDIGVPVGYNAGITFGSFLVAMCGAVASFITKFRNIFQVVALPDVETPEEVPLLQSDRGDAHQQSSSMLSMFKPDRYMVAGGFFMATAIFGMHFSGMKGMRIPNVTMDLDTRWMLAAFAPAWVISIFALNGLPRVLSLRKQLLFAVMSTLGVFSLHYIGMYAATFTQIGDLPPPDGTSFNGSIPFVIVVSVSVCCFAAFTIAAQSISRQRDDLMEAIRAKRLIDALQLEKEVLQREIKEKSDFIAIASHEMRTPLHAIAGFTELLSKTSLTEEQNDHLQLARQSVRSMEFVVDNILNYTRLSNINPVVEEKWCDLSDVIYQVMMDMSIMIESDISVLFVNKNARKTREKCDVYLFIQVIQNLVSNAYKFTPEGCVVVTYELHGSKARIIVQDTGIGIAEEQQQTLFQPFTQADKSLSRRHTGTGLGLAICDHVATVLHGRILVESRLGKGSTFTFEAPIEHEDLGLLYDTYISGSYVIIGPQDIFSTAINDLLDKIGMTAVIDGSLSLRWSRTQQGSSEIVVRFEKSIYTWNVKRPIKGYAIYDNLRSILQHRPSTDIATSSKPSPQQKVTPLPPVCDEISPTPIIPSTSASTSAPATLKTDSKPEGKKIILVAEDNSINQTLIKKQLQKLGYVAELAMNGEEAVNKVKRNGFDPYCCILMDCQMPIMDGFEATRRLREISKTFPILALTANVTDISRMESERAGMTAFLAKPLQISQLEEALRTHTPCVPNNKI